MSHLGNYLELWDIFPEAYFVQNWEKKVFGLKSIDHGGILHTEIIYNISSFLIFEESPILYPLLMHYTSLRSFQAFTKNFCDTEKKVKCRQFYF